MGRRYYVPVRRRHDIPIRCREDVPLRRLGGVILRHRWVFHLRSTCDVTGTSLALGRRRHDVLLLGGLYDEINKLLLSIIVRYFIITINYVMTS